MFQLESTPQRPGRVWSRGLELGWLGFGRLFGLTAVLGLINLLPTLYLAKWLGDAALTRDTLLQLLRSPHFDAGLLLLELLVLVLNSLVSALIILRMERTVTGAGAARELRVALGKLPALVLAGILVLITILIGTLIAVLVGGILGAVAGSVFGRGAAMVVAQICVFAAVIFIAVNLLFFQFAIMLDGKGPVAALNHSCALVFHNWWRTFLVLLITTAVIAVCAAMVILPLSLSLTPWLHPLVGTDTGRSLLVKGVLRLVGTAVFTPFVVAILYVLYRDLKVRRAPPAVPTVTVQA
jgi:hypothetical protein